MKVEVCQNEAPADWLTLLQQAGPEAGFFQSPCWASLLSRLDQAQPLYLAVYDGSERIASLLAMQEIPHDDQGQRITGGPRHWLQGTTRGWLSLYDGPVFHCPEVAPQALDTLLRWLDSYAGQQGLLVTHWRGLVPTSKLFASPQLHTCFDTNGYAAAAWTSCLLPIDEEEQVIWGRFKQRTRTAIRKAMKAGLRYRKITDTDDYASNFHEPYARTSRLAGLPVPPLETVRFEAEFLPYFSYYVVEDEVGTSLAVQGMFQFNSMATVISLATMPEAHQRKLPATDLLYWEMMRTAKAQGCRSFNLTPLRSNPRSAKEAGIKLYKEKWGARYVPFCTYRKVSGWRSFAWRWGEEWVVRRKGLVRRQRPHSNK